MAEIGWLLIDFGIKVVGGNRERNRFSVNCQTPSVKCWGKQVKHLLVQPRLEPANAPAADDDPVGP